MKDFDAEVYINAVVKDLAETTLNNSWGQEEESDVVNYAEGGCAEIYRTIGMASGLMWFYYRNESKSFVLTETVELLIKNLVIAQTDGIKFSDDSPTAAREVEESTGLQIKVGPHSDKYILFKLTDLEYVCKYKSTSIVQPGSQTTPRGKPPLPSKGFSKASPVLALQQKEGIYGIVEEVPISDIYNDIMEAGREELNKSIKTPRISPDRGGYTSHGL